MQVLKKTDNAAAPREDFILLSGRHYGHNEDGEEVMYEPGDLVPLTQQQFEHDFKDKFAHPDDYAQATKKRPAIFSPSRPNVATA